MHRFKTVTTGGAVPARRPAPLWERMETTDYPPMFVAADAASAWGQRWRRRIVAGNLALILTGSVIGFAASFFGGNLERVVGVLSAVVLLSGVLIDRVHRALSDDRSWFEGRAVAESVKSLTWRYMTRIPPFDADDRADAVFLQTLTAVRGEALRLGPGGAGRDPRAEQQITERMRRGRGLDLAGRRDLYRVARVQDQIAWYRRKAAFNGRRSALWSWVAVVAQIGAFGGAFAVAFTANKDISIVSIMGALAASATAWSQLGRHDELTQTYGLAARELDLVDAMAGDVATEEDLRELVRAGEGIMAREHGLWITKRGEEAGFKPRPAPDPALASAPEPALAPTPTPTADPASSAATRAAPVPAPTRAAPPSATAPSTDAAGRGVSLLAAPRDD